MWLKVHLVALILFMSASMSSAVVTIEWEPVDNSADLTGYKTLDLFVTADTPICCAGMLIELDSGSFYYHGADGTSPFGLAEVNQPPNPAIVALKDSMPGLLGLEFTSYVTLGGLPVSIAGGATDVGGGVLEFSEQEIDVSWFTTNLQAGRVHAARVTMTDGATGTWAVAALGQDPIEDPLTEFNGTIPEIIPEPSMIVLVFAGSGLLLRRP